MLGNQHIYLKNELATGCANFKLKEHKHAVEKKNLVCCRWNLLPPLPPPFPPSLRLPVLFLASRDFTVGGGGAKSNGREKHDLLTYS